MQQITVGALEIEVVRKDIKNIHLGVYPPDGRVRIATPLAVDDETLRLFAISKMRWIRQERDKFSNQLRQTKREYIAGESHYFAGQRYLLEIVEQKGVPRVEIRNKKYIDLYIRPNSNTAQRAKVLTEWYRHELKQVIPPLIKKWEERMEVTVKAWGIRQMKTKWGTCNAEARRIWLNLELAKQPVRCVEYIVVHEMVHLLVRHHNDAFVGYMDQFLPNWRSLRGELNGGVLGFVEWGAGES